MSQVSNHRSKVAYDCTSVEMTKRCLHNENPCSEQSFRQYARAPTQTGFPCACGVCPRMFAQSSGCAILGSPNLSSDEPVLSISSHSPTVEVDVSCNWPSSASSFRVQSPSCPATSPSNFSVRRKQDENSRTIVKNANDFDQILPRRLCFQNVLHARIDRLGSNS